CVTGKGVFHSPQLVSRLCAGSGEDMVRSIRNFLLLVVGTAFVTPLACGPTSQQPTEHTDQSVGHVSQALTGPLPQLDISGTNIVATGTTTPIILRGTNLGSWLVTEGWMSAGITGTDEHAWRTSLANAYDNGTLYGTNTNAIIE